MADQDPFPGFDSKFPIGESGFSDAGFLGEVPFNAGAQDDDPGSIMIGGESPDQMEGFTRVLVNAKIRDKAAGDVDYTWQRGWMYWRYEEDGVNPGGLPFEISVDEDYVVTVGTGLVDMERWSEDPGDGSVDNPYCYVATAEIAEAAVATLENGDTIGIWLRVNMGSFSTTANTPSFMTAFNLQGWSSIFAQWPTIVTSETRTEVSDGHAFTQDDYPATHYMYSYIGKVSRSGADVTIVQKRKSDIYFAATSTSQDAIIP